MATPTTITFATSYRDFVTTLNKRVNEYFKTRNLSRHANPENGFGFMLKLDTETAYRFMIFASSDNTTVALRPMLVVTYENK